MPGPKKGWRDMEKKGWRIIQIYFYSKSSDQDWHSIMAIRQKFQQKIDILVVKFY